MPARKKSKERIVMGGKMVASGSYGCVYHPPIPCSNLPVNRQPSTKYISKVFKQEAEANDELKRIEPLAKLDPKQDYFIYPVIKCMANATDIEKNDGSSTTKQCDFVLPKTGSQYPQLVSLNGGSEIYNYLADKYKNGSPIRYIPYLQLMAKIAKAILVLNEGGYIHQDIKPNNIMIDSANHVRLIDFGFMVPKSGLFTTSNRFLAKNYWIHPPEYWMLHQIYTKKPITELTYSRLMFKRFNQLNAVFSDKDSAKMYELYQYYWPSLCELETHYKDIPQEPTHYTLGKTGESSAMKIDVYSLGMMMVYLIQFVSGVYASPIGDASAPNAFVIPDGYRQLVRRMTDPNPVKRINMKEALLTLEKLR
jgi:serine/threonine protein kinase